MKSKPFGALFGLLALVAILGVVPAFGQEASEIDMTPGAGASASAACVAVHNCFSPNPDMVAPGTTVTWKNTDTVSHYVTSGKPSDNTTGTVFDSGNLIKPAGTYQFTFANAGTFNYFCTVHPWMTGQVIVGAASAAAPGNQTGIPLGPPYTAPSNTTTAMQPMSNMTTSQNTTAPGNQPGLPLGPPYSGNATVPEFGPVASIVLAIAVLSVVVFAAKTRVIPRF